MSVAIVEKPRSTIEQALSGVFPLREPAQGTTRENLAHNVPTVAAHLEGGCSGLLITLHHLGPDESARSVEIAVLFDDKSYETATQKLVASKTDVPVNEPDSRGTYGSHALAQRIESGDFLLSVWRQGQDGPICVINETLRARVIDDLEAQYVLSGTNPRFCYHWSSNGLEGILVLNVYGKDIAYAFHSDRSTGALMVQDPTPYDPNAHGVIPPRVYG